MKFLRVLLFFAFISLILFFGCAKRGMITGGPMDTLAPVIISSSPENYSVHFDKKDIKIVFDEYIKIDKLNQNLIISPPMNTIPEVTPMGFASKSITIKILDTLKSNTTYSFNFGRSIVDNNEGNPFTAFKYVFSTGDYIDSLKVSGNIKDAYSKKTDNFVNVVLYDATQFNDSTIYKEKPIYIANTLDSLTSFSIENIKEGSYYLFALKDQNNNYKFDPQSDKIAFYEKPITLPTEETFDLTLFKEVKKESAGRPSMTSKNKWLVPYEGDYKNLKMELLGNNKPIDFAFSKVPQKDSLHVFTPLAPMDSVTFRFKNKDYEKEYTIKTRQVKMQDSLKVSLNKSGSLDFRDSLQISTTTPVRKLAADKIQLIGKDSANVPFTLFADSLNLATTIHFEKKEKEKYTLTLLPGAITDFYGKQNDSIVSQLTTKAYTDYGNLTITLENTKNFPLIVQILNDKEVLTAFEILTENKPVVFNHLTPNKYFIRVIYDENNNGKWDTGKYLERRQPEEVYYFAKEIDVRPNWEMKETLILPVPRE